MLLIMICRAQDDMSGCKSCIYPSQLFSASAGISARTVKWTRTVMYFGHCACSRQLNMNAASRLKTSPIQVMVTSGYLFFSHLLPAFRWTEPVLVSPASLLKRTTFPQIQAKIPPRANFKTAFCEPNVLMVVNVHASRRLQRFANIFGFLCRRSVFAWHLVRLGFYLVAQLVVCVGLRSR